MTTYMLVEIESLSDEGAYARYVDAVAAIVERHGGRYLARTDSVASPSAVPLPVRVILIEFEDRDQLARCFESAEYLEIAALRERSASSRALVFEGCG